MMGKNIYVDGASRGNHHRGGFRPSGFGVFFGDRDRRNASYGLHEVESDLDENPPTNQRAELYAIRHALDYILTNAQNWP
ncbi:hypothetical protein KGF54_005188 [Candida jiufengensis]|uniref:uncharacterized protein n=1 Tax=Candida jiufengensis TaxID=497108 RepID=UPI0022255281|nr:uncharacterized protein KGF54_005188 [Candida jiufengensis]KAI5950231.1 hypothetical protein KGF54_005188 [Candida jiufengensis]